MFLADAITEIIQEIDNSLIAELISIKLINTLGTTTSRHVFRQGLPLRDAHDLYERAAGAPTSALT